MNQKGTAQDILWIAVFLFASVIILFVINFSGNLISTSLTNHTAINGTLAEQPISEIQNSVNRADGIIFVLFIGLVLGLIITSWFISGNPIFMFVYFLVIVITIIISMGLSNGWETMSESSVFGTTLSHFPITNHLMANLPLYMLVIGFIGLVVMFAKPFMSDME